MEDNNQPPGKRFKYLRSQFLPKIKEADEALKNRGINPQSTDYRRTRDVLTRIIIEKETSGEIDQLTRLYNRSGWNRRAREEVINAKRQNQPLTVMILDVNNLKTTNDGPGGHDAGDKLLIKVAEAITQISRNDVIARYGGDEFAVLLRNTTIEGAVGFWERLNTAFNAREIDISAGIAPMDDDIEGSTKNADKAMYEAKALSKETGKNQLTAYTKR